jgi:hypothetical protein
MVEPVLRISISPHGLLKVDAVVSTDAVRVRAFDFYADVLEDIRTLDRAIREKTRVDTAFRAKPGNETNEEKSTC